MYKFDYVSVAEVIVQDGVVLDYIGGVSIYLFLSFTYNPDEYNAAQLQHSY